MLWFLFHVRSTDIFSPDENGHQQMELLLPEAPYQAIPIEDLHLRAQYANVPRKYDMKLSSTTEETYMKNLYAFEEELLDDDDVASDLGVDEDIVPDSVHSKRPRSTGPARGLHKKKRITALTGTVTNETSIQPQKQTMVSTLPPASATDTKPARMIGKSRSLLTPEYREILRQRRIESSTPKRSVIMMDSGDAGMNTCLLLVSGRVILNHAPRTLSWAMPKRARMNRLKSLRVSHAMNSLTCFSACSTSISIGL